MKSVSGFVTIGKVLLLTGCVIAIGGCGAHGGADEITEDKARVNIKQVKPAQDDHNALSVTLRPTKPTYVLGEPVYVILQLDNHGATPIGIFPYLEPGEGAVHIEVTAPDEKRAPFVPLGESYNEVAEVTVAPRESRAAVFPVFFGGRGWTFDRLGVYHLTAVYSGVMKSGELIEVVSEPVGLTVDEAEEEIGKFLIQEGVASSESGKYLTWHSGDHLRKGKAHLMNLLDRWPESTVASYARFALGKGLSDSFMDYSVGRVRPPDCAKAREYLDRIRVDVLPDNLKIHWNLALARCVLQERKVSQARLRLATAKTLIDDRPEYRDLLSMVSRMEGSAAE